MSLRDNIAMSDIDNRDNDEEMVKTLQETEHQIFQVLEKCSKDKLTIFTSHRLNNVMLAERMIVLEGGRITLSIMYKMPGFFREISVFFVLRKRLKNIG